MQRGFGAVTKSNNTAVARRTEENHENFRYEVDVLVWNRKRYNKQAVQVAISSTFPARWVPANITNELLL